MPIDADRIRAAVVELLVAIGEDPSSERLRETPRRVSEAYAELFIELLEEGARSGHFHCGPAPLIAACLVGAIAESLVGPLSPPARAARDAGQPSPGLEQVSQALVDFCLRAVGAPQPEEQR